jgi:hypothetical protein
MTTPDTSTPLPPALLARNQEAQVLADEAKARKAAADAATSALTLAQTRYKALVPDLTGVATNAVTDKSAGVAFSGLVTHSALNHAAKVIANRIATVLTSPDQGRQPVILITSQTDLLTSDLLSSTVEACLCQLVEFADQVLFEPRQPVFRDERRAELARSGIAAQAVKNLLGPPLLLEQATSVGVAAPSGVSAAGALAAAGLGPIGLAAAAAAAVPSIISLFSSTTTVKDHTADITDLATTTSVLAAVADKLDGYTLVHEDFRLAPVTSVIREEYGQLADRRARLIFRQARVQAIKNETDLFVSRTQAEQDAARKAQPLRPDDLLLAEQIAAAQLNSENCAALLSVISGAITSIDAFTTAVNATAAGARSPLAIASLNELLHRGGADAISYVLSVRGLGGQSEEYTKDRHVGFDTYTTLADASVSFMLYDVAARKVIKSGIANGVSSVHGRLGKPPTGLIGPNAADAIGDQAADAPPGNQSGQPSGARKKWWRHWS